MSKKPSLFSRIAHRAARIFSLLLSKLSKLFDRIVYSQKASMIVSLLVSIVICVSINYNDLNYRFFNKDQEVLNLSNIPVNAIYDSQEYVVEGLPDAVAVTLSGSPSDMQLYKAQYQVEVSADLRNFSPGKNVVEFQASGLPNGVSATMNPNSAEINISQKTKRTFSVTTELILGPQQSADNFEIASISATSVVIKATQTQLDAIRTVKALIDTSGHDKDFTTTAPLIAYDVSGAPVSVTITPDSVQVVIKYKEVSKEKTEEDTQDSDDASDSGANREELN